MEIPRDWHLWIIRVTTGRFLYMTMIKLFQYIRVLNECRLLRGFWTCSEELQCYGGRRKQSLQNDHSLSWSSPIHPSILPSCRGQHSSHKRYPIDRYFELTMSFQSYHQISRRALVRGFISVLRNFTRMKVVVAPDFLGVEILDNARHCIISPSVRRFTEKELEHRKCQGGLCHQSWDHSLVF